MVLTPREWQIAELIADGMPRAEVAQELLISKRTVDIHLQNAYGKLPDVQGRLQLSLWVAEQRELRKPMREPEIVLIDIALVQGMVAAYMNRVPAGDRPGAALRLIEHMMATDASTGPDRVS